MRTQSCLVRTAVLCGLSLGACLVGARSANAEVTLAERDGWTFFTDGRINSFFSQGFGDDFPKPVPNPGGPDHDVTGSSGAIFTAGYSSSQGDANGKYLAGRVRSGFLASILAFGMKRQISETSSVKSYIALWGTAQSYGRDRSQDLGRSTSKGFDVREGWVDFEGRWGGLVAGRQGGLFGGTSAEIDFLYGHNYGLGLPCIDDFYASCGHIGTGALGPGFAAGFVYSTPSLAGLKLQAGLFDPVRLLGAWELVPYPRPEGRLSFLRQLSARSLLKLAVEGMYQRVGIGGTTLTDKVWGVAGGGRLELGPLRLGGAVFRGKGLGAYVALQNSPSTFSAIPRPDGAKELRTFTGVYGQSALVFGRAQISAGVGRVVDDQLEIDKQDATLSGLKTQTGVSAAFYYSLTENVVVGVDYFRFITQWWGAPNSMFDPNDPSVVVILPGRLPGERQVMNFINVGATFHW